MMGAGKLDQRVTIQRASATRDAYGAEALTWSEVATVPAQVRERGGREPLLADRPVMVVAFEVTIRAGFNVTHQDRLVWETLTLQVETATPLPRGFQTLRCLQVEV